MEQEMKYIYTVYKCRSFSKAASELFMTQPALSIAVQRVESQLGMPLFDRTSKPLKLTQAGEYYIRKFYEIQNLENELSQQISDLSSLHTGSLRIGGTHYFNSYVLPPVLTEFSQKYPGIEMVLTESGSGELLRMLYDHNIDITFNCAANPKDTFRRTPCFIDMILITVPKNFPVNEKLKKYALTARDIMAKKHQRFDRPAVSVKEFADTPFILLSPGNDLYNRSRIFFQEADTEPNVRLQVSQLVTAWHLSSAGMGAAFISDFLVTSETSENLFYRINSPQAVRLFDLAMSDRHYISNAMKIFEQTFRNWYGLHVPERTVR